MVIDVNIVTRKNRKEPRVMDEVKEKAAAIQIEVIPLAPTHKDAMIMAVLEETALCVNIICKALARRVNPVLFFTISHAHFIKRAWAE